MKHWLLFLLIGLLVPLGSATAATQRISSSVTIDNSQPKTDTSGVQLDAHEGTIVWDTATGLYWMVGNTYSCDGGYQWIHQASTWCGFRTYTSPDLVKWTNRGSTFNPADSYWQSLCSGMGCFDVRLIQDKSAGVWRMWFNAYNSRSGYVVMSAPGPGGPWHLNATPNLAFGNNNPGRGNGAGGLYTDSSGVGYLIYTAWTNGGIDIIEKLDPHMVTGTGIHVHVPDLNAEAPSLFNGPGGTVLVTYNDPGCAWCGGVPTSYAVSTGGPLGLWTLKGQISALSCNGQAAAQVATLTSGQQLWMTDQWTNIMPGPRGPGVEGWNGMSDIDAMQQWDQTLATQLWEPLNITSNGTISPVRCPATVVVSP